MTTENISKLNPVNRAAKAVACLPLGAEGIEATLGSGYDEAFRYQKTTSGSSTKLFLYLASEKAYFPPSYWARH
jgi:hypothetical protein